MYATIFFRQITKCSSVVSVVSRVFFSFYLLCALVSFISISPCPLGAFGLSQLSAARPSTNGLSRLLHNSFADCAACAKGCNGGQETQLLPFVVPRLVFTSFLCPVHSCATALQLHCCLCSALWFLNWFSRQKMRSLDVVSRMFSSKCQLMYITSVSGIYIGTVAGISMMGQFHEFFHLIFGEFLSFGPTIRLRAALFFSFCCQLLQCNAHCIIHEISVEAWVSFHAFRPSVV